MIQVKTGYWFACISTTESRSTKYDIAKINEQ